MSSLKSCLDRPTERYLIHKGWAVEMIDKISLARAKGYEFMMLKRFLPFLVLSLGTLAVPNPLLAQTAQLAGTGTVEYHLIHKFHKVVGKSKALAVRGTVEASGLKVMARAQVGTFDSDNANRDTHMMETVEGEKYPWVSVKAALPGYKLPTGPSTQKITLQASVELHGVAVSHPIDVTLETKDGTHFEVSFEFPESLTAHKIERPSLMFVAVDDNITIAGKASVTAKQ
jgi:YceI-like domain